MPVATDMRKAYTRFQMTAKIGQI